MDDYFRSQQSPLGDSQMTSNLVSPPRNGPLLPRRFTTDSGRVPTLSTITTTTQRAPEQQDFAVSGTTTLHKVQLLEKKRLDYERIKEHKRRFEAEIHKLSAQERQEEMELAQMAEDLRFNGNSLAGHQSEPTTPPEYRETSSGFPSLFSRPNRYSTSSLTSPPGLGLFNRPGRSGSQLASPQSGIIQSRFAFDDQLPSRSVPGSRRNSDEDEKEEAVRQDPTSHRSTNALNRYSMPVTRSRTYFQDIIGLEDSNNTTGFLFDDEENSNENRTTPQANTNDAFASIFRHSSYSMNMSPIGSSPINGSTAAQATDASSAPGSRPASIRHSQDFKLFQDGNTGSMIASAPDTPSAMMSPQTQHVVATPPKLTQSYSSNELQTAKAVTGTTGVNGSASANNHAQQHFHNHNASIGRIPPNAMPHHRLSLTDTNSAVNTGRETTAFPNIGSTLQSSALQASAVPFGPGNAIMGAQMTNPSGTTPMSPVTGNNAFSYYGGQQQGFTTNPYAGNGQMNMPAFVNAMQQMSMAGGGNAYTAQSYGGQAVPVYQPPAARQAPVDSQARVIQSRRQLDGEAMARYANAPLSQFAGEIYRLCKDQHGCRYLQRMIETGSAHDIHEIWLETKDHVVELMTDPFGNYLCQKLFEHCTVDDRTFLIQKSGEHMVEIALNQHGTRALQKMIEYVTEDVQVSLVVEALRFQVVELIQDLNGNHVIQKCLNKLSSEQARFIFEAVGNNCIEVGTHRHGCCVLQRCIDHADGPVKTWLVFQIIREACALVQDPFGNYVVQYIIDLSESSFTEPLVQEFRGRIVSLSKHKFSSNVVEKCLRCASDESKNLITDELLASGEMDRLLRDSFANYVIQTSLEYATPDRKTALVEAVRPHLASIRATPYGRRIQAKVAQYESRNNGTGPGQTDITGGQIPMRTTNTRSMASNTSIVYNNNNNGMNGAIGQRSAYPKSSTITVPPTPLPTGSQAPRMVQHTQFGAAANPFAGLATVQNGMGNGNGVVNGDMNGADYEQQQWV